jgi:hypothetical protein
MKSAASNLKSNPTEWRMRHCRWPFAHLLTATCILVIMGQLNHLGAADFRVSRGDVGGLIAAIHSANDEILNPGPDRIILRAGRYTLRTVDNVSDGPNGLPSIVSDITIIGKGADKTIIERDPLSVAFRITHVDSTGTLLLDGVSIRGGFGDFLNGAGIFNQGGSVTINNSIIADNEVVEGVGGGIANAGGTLTIANSTIARNFAEDAGGIINFRSNSSDNLAITITNSTIAENVGFFSGGGIVNDGSLIITNSTIAKNLARNGDGAGIWNISGNAKLTNCTISKNVIDFALFAGGAGILNSRGTVELQNTILALNEILQSLPDENFAGLDCVGSIVSLGNNIVGNLTDCGILLLGSDLTGDPGLGDFTDDGTPGHGYFPLLADTQAANVGNPIYCPATDQLGNPRAGSCDIGSIEFQPFKRLRPCISTLVKQNCVGLKGLSRKMCIQEQRQFCSGLVRLR